YGNGISVGKGIRRIAFNQIKPEHIKDLFVSHSYRLIKGLFLKLKKEPVPRIEPCHLLNFRKLVNNLVAEWIRYGCEIVHIIIEMNVAEYHKNPIHLFMVSIEINLIPNVQEDYDKSD